METKRSRLPLADIDSPDLRHERGEDCFGEKRKEERGGGGRKSEKQANLLPKISQFVLEHVLGYQTTRNVGKIGLDSEPVGLMAVEGC